MEVPYLPRFQVAACRYQFVYRLIELLKLNFLWFFNHQLLPSLTLT